MREKIHGSTIGNGVSGGEVVELDNEIYKRIITLEIDQSRADEDSQKICERSRGGLEVFVSPTAEEPIFGEILESEKWQGISIG